MPHHSLVGQKLSNGKYEVTEFIGRGGMSEVFKGIDVQLKRKVAIKVLDPDFATNPYWIRRFREEAETAANLEHANIVTIYDIHSQENAHYCVMQYLPQGLVSLLKQKKRALTPLEAVQVLEPIAEALAFVHRKGVVHRDIKPGNIMLDEHETPVLTDFGIAVRDDSTRLEGHATTGTPEYMSPEQIRGEANIDGRSDVYSLGIVLYELLTGNVPFHSEDPQAVFYQQVHEPLPEKPLDDHRVPKRMRDILFRCLEKSAKDRYQSADSLVEAFNDILRNPPTLRPIKLKRDFPIAAVLVPALLIVAAAVLYAMIRSGVGFKAHADPIRYVDSVIKRRIAFKPRPRPFASLDIYLQDSTELSESTAVPFPGELSLSLEGEGVDTTFAMSTARATIKFWPDSAGAGSRPASDSVPPGSFDVYHSFPNAAVPLRVSAKVPYYEPKSETLTLRKGPRDSVRLKLSPLARFCTKCGYSFSYQDTVCDSCKSPRRRE